MLDIAAPHVESLPIYSRRDPDSISLLSAAPSYVSETPTYTAPPSHDQRRTHSSLLPPLAPGQQSQTCGLPAPRYAPGFESRASGRISEPWSNLRTSQNSKQYHAVARRRANQATKKDPTITNSPAALSSSSSTNGSPTSSSTTVNAYPVTVGSTTDPVNPLEDPYLVGEEAATRARQQRVYREMCLMSEETSRYENRSWDFMYSQMEDWQEREQSWKQFRNNVGNTKVLSRRLGFKA